MITLAQSLHLQKIWNYLHCTAITIIHQNICIFYCKRNIQSRISKYSSKQVNPGRIALVIHKTQCINTNSWFMCISRWPEAEAKKSGTSSALFGSVIMEHPWYYQHCLSKIISTLSIFQRCKKIKVTLKGIPRSVQGPGAPQVTLSSQNEYSCRDTDDGACYFADACKYSFSFIAMIESMVNSE